MIESSQAISRLSRRFKPASGSAREFHPKEGHIVTYCTCPNDESADSEVQKLSEMGFKNAYALSGGLDAARSAGLEVVTPADK